MAITVIEVVTQRIDEKNPTGRRNFGDQSFFTDDLLNAQGQVVGTHSGCCTYLRIAAGNAPHLYECQATFTLAQGQVTARGVFPDPMAVGQSSRVAITGGTDAFAKARGQVTWTQLAGGAGRIRLDIEL
jgi:hypothetical protein